MLAAMAGAGGAAPATYAPAWYLNTEVLLAFAAGVVGIDAGACRRSPRRLARRPTSGDRRCGWQAIGRLRLLALLALLLGLADAVGGAHLQPVHLFPVLK